MTRSKELLERFVTEVTLAYLEREGVRPEPASEVVDSTAARDVEVLRQRLEAVAVDYAEGVVTQEQLLAATRTLRARIAELDGALAASTRSGPCRWWTGSRTCGRPGTGSTWTPAGRWSGRSGGSSWCPSVRAGPASTRKASG